MKENVLAPLLLRYLCQWHATHDDAGTELESLEEVRREAMVSLPAIAKDEVPRDGDRQAYTVLVTNEDRKPVYSATLSFAGLWLNRD